MNKNLGLKRLLLSFLVVAFLLPQVILAEVTLGNSNSCIAPDPIYILKKVSVAKPTVLAAGGTKGLTLVTSRVVFAVRTLSIQKKLVGNKKLASAAVRQILLSSIQHTINVIKKRLVEILTKGTA